MSHSDKICKILNTLEEGKRYHVEHGLLFDSYNNEKCIDSPYIYLMDEIYEYMKAGGMIG